MLIPKSITIIIKSYVKKLQQTVIQLHSLILLLDRCLVKLIFQGIFAQIQARNPLSWYLLAIPSRPIASFSLHNQSLPLYNLSTQVILIELLFLSHKTLLLLLQLVNKKRLFTLHKSIALWWKQQINQAKPNNLLVAKYPANNNNSSSNNNNHNFLSKRNYKMIKTITKSIARKFCPYFKLTQKIVLLVLCHHKLICKHLHMLNLNNHQRMKRKKINNSKNNKHIWVNY